MTRHILALTMATGFAALPAAAFAQTSLRPPVELGADVSSGPDGAGGWSSISPRVTVNLTNRTALETVYAPQQNRARFSHVDYVLVQLKRTLLSRDRVSLFGALGVSQATRYYDAVEVETPFPGVYEPNRTWGPTLGFGAEVPLAPFLRLRGEAQYVLSQEALLRFAGGVTLPVGRYPSPPSAAERAAMTGTPAGAVDLGQTVWITSADGRRVQGEVVSLSADGMTLSHASGATAFAAGQIQRIEATDHLLDGVLVGAGVGAAAGGAFGVMLGRVLCEDTDSCVLFATLVLGGLGGGMGTLAGAIIDSFRDAPRPVFERPIARGASLRLAPLITTGRLGAGGMVRW
jgi:hypothetical protein